MIQLIAGYKVGPVTSLVLATRVACTKQVNTAKVGNFNGTTTSGGGSGRWNWHNLITPLNAIAHRVQEDLTYVGVLLNNSDLNFVADRNLWADA